MFNHTLKIIIPMAGYGKRLRPHTWSKPKPLVSAAGKPVLGHVLDLITADTDPADTEIAFIIGYQGEQVAPYMQANYPEIKAHYYVQEEMIGQSHAVAMAREHMQGPTLIIFVDTIAETDFSFWHTETADGVIWVKEVEDPRRFGVVAVGADGNATGLIEKPDSIENKLAIIGYFYFARGEDLLAAIDKQIAQNVQTKGEYYLADAINLMLEDGMKLRPEVVEVWLDAGQADAILEANRYLLENGRDNTQEALRRKGVTVNPPVYIHPSAKIDNSTIGPNASIAADCQISDSKIENSVVEAGAQVHNSKLKESIVGERAVVDGTDGIINIGDDASVKAK